MNESNKKIRVLHIIGGMDRAGAETWLYNMSQSSLADNFQMDFLVHEAREYDYEKDLTRAGRKFIRCTSINNPLKYIISLTSILGRLEPYDIVHAHTHYFSVFALFAARFSGVKTIFCHSHIDMVASNKNLSYGRIFYRKLAVFFINLLKPIKISVSENACKDLFGKDASKLKHTYVIPCGIDVSKFQITKTNLNLKRSLGIPESSRVIGHVGRLEVQKNHQFLLQIFKAAKEIDNNLHLVLVGQGTLHKELQCIAEKLQIEDSLTFTGAIDNTAEVMLNTMDAFVFPSLFEGVPLALVEAQAAGLPTITSDRIPEAAEVYPGATLRLSLEDSIQNWAKHVTRLDMVNKQARKDLAIEAIIARKMDLLSTAKLVLDLYVKYI